MRKPEQLAWVNMRREMSGLWVAQRHEDRFTCGIPDVSFVLPGGVGGWIELKAGDRFKVSPEQIQWMLLRARYGQCCILAAWDGRVWHASRVGEHNFDRLRVSDKCTDISELGMSGSPAHVILALANGSEIAPSSVK